MRALFFLVLALMSACATTSTRDEPIDEVVAFQSVPLSAMRYAPASLSTPSVPAFQFQCTGTAQRIEPPSGTTDYREITVWNAACTAGTCVTSATPVFLGGVRDAKRAQVTAVTNATGMPICNVTTACISTFATYTVPNLECIAGSNTTVTVQVLK